MGSHVKRRERQSLFFINVPSEKVGTQVRVCDFSVFFSDSMAHFQAFSTASCHVPYFSNVAASVKPPGCEVGIFLYPNSNIKAEGKALYMSEEEDVSPLNRTN